MAQLADKFPNLEHLTLENFDVNFPELGEFKTLQSLRLISRWKVEVCNEFYRSVGRRIENLQKLQLISVRVRGDQVHHFLAISIPKFSGGSAKFGPCTPTVPERASRLSANALQKNQCPDSENHSGLGVPVAAVRFRSVQM